MKWLNLSAPGLPGRWQAWRKGIFVEVIKEGISRESLWQVKIDLELVDTASSLVAAKALAQRYCENMDY